MNKKILKIIDKFKQEIKAYQMLYGWTVSRKSKEYEEQIANLRARLQEFEVLK